MEPIELKVLRGGKDAWNTWRGQGNNNPQLANLTLDGRSFAGFDLRQVNFNYSTLRNCDFNDSQLHGASFDEATLENTSFVNASGNLRAIKAKFRNCNFTVCKFSLAEFQDAEFSGCVFMDADFHKASFHHAVLKGEDLYTGDFRHARLVATNFERALLGRANFRSASFERAVLHHANLIGARFNAETKFTNAQVHRAKIDGLTLETLKDYGGLSVVDIRDMDLRNDLAKLRATYSGFLLGIHALLLTLFVFPYAWFVLQQWSLAHFAAAPTVGAIPLWEAFLRYLVSGGQDWRSGWNVRAVPVTLFLIALFYNILRGVFLWKTKQLELEEQVYKLPSDFSFEKHPAWGFWFKVARIALWFNLGAVVLHTIYFMRVLVPV